MREMVDVLTLSATPIPRTLYLSLTGARDMSVIQTPPRERLPIETYIAQDSDELVREAVLREVNRGGQVFVLHNRVQTIDWMRRRLERLLPGIRVGVGHGQMGEKALAGVMHRFVRGEYDVLLCTTIIESGVDIPNVNTILIDRADRFGMAELYQLRGRVGRGEKKSACVLLRGDTLSETGKQRLALMRETQDGFRLAEEDLKLRGGGELLGTRQSGEEGFRIASLEQTQRMIQMAQDDARLLLDRDGGLGWAAISDLALVDEATIARVSLELGSRGTGRYETLTAIPVDEFIASL